VEGGREEISGVFTIDFGVYISLPATFSCREAGLQKLPARFMLMLGTDWSSLPAQCHVAHLLSPLGTNEHFPD
jgi:hypothetical protein